MAGTILVNTDTLLIAQGQLAALQNDLATLQGAVGSVWTNIDGAIQFNSAISSQVDGQVTAASTAIANLSTALTNISTTVTNVLNAADATIAAL